MLNINTLDSKYKMIKGISGEERISINLPCDRHSMEIHVILMLLERLRMFSFAFHRKFDTDQQNV